MWRERNLLAFRRYTQEGNSKPSPAFENNRIWDVGLTLHMFSQTVTEQNTVPVQVFWSMEQIV